MRGCGGGKVKRRRKKVGTALSKTRPSLNADGGDVELVEVTADGVVKVKLIGPCGGCPMSQMTLKLGIERVLKMEVQELKELVAIQTGRYSRKTIGGSGDGFRYYLRFRTGLYRFILSDAYSPDKAGDRQA
jgi:Fe-S cluster biogenesis protein NfuA